MVISKPEGGRSADPRAVAEDIIRRDRLEREKKEKQAEKRQNLRNSFKTKKALKEESEQQARKAQLDLRAEQARQRAAWTQEDGADSVLSKPIRSPFPEHKEEDSLTASDLSVMDRLKVGQNKYGKLPRDLVTGLKNAGADQVERCFKARLADGLKRIFGKSNDKENEKSKAGGQASSPQNEMVQNCSPERTREIGCEVEDDQPEEFKPPKCPIILIFAHPTVPDTHVVKDLARDFVDLIKKGKMGEIDYVYQYEELQMLGRCGSSQTPPPVKVQRFGGIHLINIQDYHSIAMGETAYDSEGKLIKIPRWSFGRSQKDYTRKNIIANHIMADAECKKIFIITDRIKPDNAEATIRLYRELAGKTGRRVMPVYINCKAGRYNRCMLSPMLHLASKRGLVRVQEPEETREAEEKKELKGVKGATGNEREENTDDGVAEGPSRPHANSTDSGIDVTGEASGSNSK